MPQLMTGSPRDSGRAPSRKLPTLPQLQLRREELPGKTKNYIHPNVEKGRMGCSEGLLAHSMPSVPPKAMTPNAMGGLNDNAPKEERLTFCLQIRGM